MVLLMMTVSPTVSADSILELAPGLNVILPEPLSLHYIQSDVASESPVLMGSIEGAPGYFIVADKVVEQQRTSVLWEKLEMEVRGRADRHSFETGDRGTFVTTDGAKVWYRSYRYAVGKVVHKPVYYLIRQDKSSYWVTLTVAENIDGSVAKPIADAILKRAILSDGS